MTTVAGTPNYKNDLLLNVVEAVLPAGAEQWKIVAQRYQQSSGESFLRFYDDVRRHFNDKLCKKNQRETGLNNKSAPLLHVARAQEIQRKILINEATMNLGGDNENDEDEDDDDDDDEDVNDFEASVTHETPSSVSEIAPVAAVPPNRFFWVFGYFWRPPNYLCVKLRVVFCSFWWAVFNFRKARIIINNVVHSYEMVG